MLGKGMTSVSSIRRRLQRQILMQKRRINEEFFEQAKGRIKEDFFLQAQGRIKHVTRALARARTQKATGIILCGMENFYANSSTIFFSSFLRHIKFLPRALQARLTSNRALRLL